MKTNKYQLLKTIISLIIVSLTALSCVLPSFAASYPTAYFTGDVNANAVLLKDREYNITFTIFPEYKNEKYTLKIYEGFDEDPYNEVGSAEDTYYNSGQYQREVTVRGWKPKTTGTYLIVLQLSFYSLFEWHNAPTSRKIWLSVTDDINKHTHLWGEGKVTKNATCTTAGSKLYTCSICKKTKTEAIKAEGHKWNYGTVTKNASATEFGITEYRCTVCNAIKHEAIAKYGTTLFDDVKDIDQFYFYPVYWAVDNGITSGTGNGKFSPDATCTRSQIVTLLYRAHGSPEPKTSSNPFKDVKSTEYYYKAVLWAVENKITAGTSANTFSPNDKCTRSQIVTFLYRANGSPASGSTANPFKDVKSSDYYYKAVLWAVANKITSGTSATTFSPMDSCTRGQVVTFIYRLPR